MGIQANTANKPRFILSFKMHRKAALAEFLGGVSGWNGESDIHKYSIYNLQFSIPARPASDVT
jgi:hypothetical protein